MSRPILSQLGLRIDPLAAQRLSEDEEYRISLLKGHDDSSGSISSVNSLPISGRIVANPYPLFAIGVGASLLVFGLIFVNARGLTNPQIFLNFGLPLGGIGVMTAAMFAFAAGDTFLATAAGTFAGLLGGLSLLFLPWIGITASFIETSPTEPALAVIGYSKAVGLLFFATMIPLFVLAVASVKTAVPIATIAMCVVVALILQGAAYLHSPQESLTKGCGALFIIVAISLFYTALSVLLKEGRFRYLPVLPVPRIEE